MERFSLELPLIIIYLSPTLKTIKNPYLKPDDLGSFQKSHFCVQLYGKKKNAPNHIDCINLKPKNKRKRINDPVINVISGQWK